MSENLENNGFENRLNEECLKGLLDELINFGHIDASNEYVYGNIKSTNIDRVCEVLKTLKGELEGKSTKDGNDLMRVAGRRLLSIIEE